MAKPREGLPGNSGHMHISLVDKEGKNLFARQSEDKDAKWADMRYLSDMGRHDVALEVMPGDPPALVGGHHMPDVLIGQDLLRTRRVWFSYSTNRLYL